MFKVGIWAMVVLTVLRHCLLSELLPVPLSTVSNSLDSISMTCNSTLGKWMGLMLACAYHKHTIEFVMQSADQLIEF